MCRSRLFLDPGFCSYERLKFSLLACPEARTSDHLRRNLEETGTVGLAM